MASGNHALHPLTMVCIADDGAVRKIVAATREFGAGLPDEVAARLAIIAEELVSNLIDHAALPAGAAIEFGLALAGGRVWLTLSDTAAAFDPRVVTDAAIPVRGGSAGLTLVRAWAEIASYDRVRDRNVLKLSLPAG